MKPERYLKTSRDESYTRKIYNALNKKYLPMKIIKFKYLFIVSAIIITMAACSEDFLDVQPKGQFLTTTYYLNQEQAFAGLTAVYDVLRKNSGGFENMITMMNAGSDDFWAGGGGPTDGMGIQSFAIYTINSFSMPRSFWSDYYAGIFRANILLQKLPDIPMSESLKARYAAEAKALRAFYYFNLLRMFRNIPLIIEPLTTAQIYTVVQATPAAVYAKIEQDLIEAIPALPGIVPAAEAGRFTRGAAQALLGKVYLYQGKNGLAAAQLEAVNGTPGAVNQYGNRLLPNFNDLWVVGNRFNAESILEVAHTNVGLTGWGNWGHGSDEGNSVNVMVGPRGYTRPAGSPAPDLPSGWSFNPVTQELYNALLGDPRFGATILDLEALRAAGHAGYIVGHQNTGFFLNKFIPRRADVHVGAGDVVLNYRQNTYIIRLADTYLLEAEALGGTGPRAQALLDAVRGRVGLPSIPVSMTAIRNERRLELAGEGHRWFDLVRWGEAATRLAHRGFVAGKHEMLPIPYEELENTLIVQNPLYE